MCLNDNVMEGNLKRVIKIHTIDNRLMCGVQLSNNKVVLNVLKALSHNGYYFEPLGFV